MPSFVTLDGVSALHFRIFRDDSCMTRENTSHFSDSLAFILGPWPLTQNYPVISPHLLRFATKQPNPGAVVLSENLFARVATVGEFVGR